MASSRSASRAASTARLLARPFAPSAAEDKRLGSLSKGGLERAYTVLYASRKCRSKEGEQCRSDFNC